MEILQVRSIRIAVGLGCLFRHETDMLARRQIHVEGYRSEQGFSNIKKEHPVLLLVCAAALPAWDPTPLLYDRLPAPHLMEQTPATAQGGN